MTDEHIWKLPEKPEKPEMIRVMILNRSPFMERSWPLSEQLIWDQLVGEPGDTVDIPVDFLGMRPRRLRDALARLQAARVLTAEGVTVTPPVIQYSQEAQIHGAVRLVQDEADKRANDAARKQANVEPREPRGFSLPAQRIDA